MQGLHGGCGELEHQLACVRNDLGGHVHESAAKRCRKGCHRNHWGAHVYLERLEQKERREHGVVEGGIWSETLEREFLEAEVFEGPVDKFVSAAFMVGTDDRFGPGHEVQICVVQVLVHNAAHAKVGVDEGAGPTPRQEELLLFQERTPKDGSAKALPATAPVSEFKELPDVLVSFPKVVLVGGLGMVPTRLLMSGRNRPPLM